MPHELVTWTARERRYWSEYSEDCKTHEAVPVDGNGRRALRLFGGRKIVLRAHNGGLCDPEACPEYQNRQCNLSGRLIFFIPGIRSISAFDLATNSFYAMQAAIEKFQTIAFIRGGRISGFLDDRRTPFFITKRLCQCSAYPGHT
jgi:Recombination directionality factor-like